MFKRGHFVGAFLPCRPRPAAIALAVLLIGGASAVAAPVLNLQLTSTPSTSTENTGVSCSVGFEFLHVAGSDVVELTLANTTPPAIGSRLTAVGLEWPDVFTSLPVFASGGTSSYFDTLNYNVSVSPGWMNAPGGYDVMITSDGNFEGGNPNGSPQAGQSQVIRLDLGVTGLSALQLLQVFENFYTGDHDPLIFDIARFQSVGPQGAYSDKVINPEPATLAMLGLAAGLIRKRSRRPRA